MAKFSLLLSDQVTSLDVETTLAQLGAKMQAYDEAGTSQILIDIDIAGYTVQTKGNGALPAGTGTADRLVATAGDDLVIWDSGLVSGVAFDVPGADRHRLEAGSQTVAYEQFDLGAGNDVLNLTYSAANNGVASPGAYGFDATAWGGAGSDVLLGGAGDDRLLGDGSSGTAAPSPGRDTLWGGAGNDRLFGDNGSTNVDESVGSFDTLFGGLGNDTMYGEGGQDTLIDTAGINIFYGGGGNDTLVSGAGNTDLMYGGAGNDRLDQADTAYGGAGNDTIDGGSGAFDNILFGDAGDDTIFGGGGNDTLYGGTGADSLYGGAGQDVIHAGTDSIAAADVDIVGWDGYSIGAVTIVASAGSNFNSDTIDGGSDVPDDPDNTDSVLGIQDLVVMDMDANSPLNVLSYTAQGSGAVVLANVEAIVATLGADLINLTYSAGGTHLAYDGDVFINASYGNDIVFSGSGSDTIVGDNLVPLGGSTPGNDLLYGGSGDDTIYGDFIGTNPFGADAGGDDTLDGGFGNDTLYGGAGNDTIVDPDGADVYGGLGDDIIGVHLSPFIGGEHTIDGGPGDDVTDGNDFVWITGNYSVVHSNLGAGDDRYFGGLFSDVGESGAGARTDIVFGGDGNDAIATFHGDDTLYGGAGQDVLWGGDNDGGGNFLYGGDGVDYLYGGESGNDVMYGGADTDYYYWAEWQSGGNDQIWDQARTGEASDGAHNYLIVFGAFDTDEQPSPDEPNPDFLANGFGVFQVSHDLTQPGTITFPDDSQYQDGLQLMDNGNGTWTLQSLYTGSNITFDPNDIATIVLWNNDAVNPNDPNVAAGIYGPGAPVLTYYNWNGTTYVYSDTPL